MIVTQQIFIKFLQYVIITDFTFFFYFIHTVKWNNFKDPLNFLWQSDYVTIHDNQSFIV